MALKDFSAQDHLVISTLGLEFATAEILGGAVGFWLDKKYNTLPWFLLVGVVLGFMLGLYIVLRRTQEMDRLAAQEKKKNERR